MSERTEVLNSLRLWVAERIEAEVAHRPDENVYKRVLRDTWNQVDRKLVAMVGQNDHDIDPTAETLWRIIDDIDTLDDACRGDDQSFREAVRRHVRRRFECLTSDDGMALRRTKATP